MALKAARKNVLKKVVSFFPRKIFFVYFEILLHFHVFVINISRFKDVCRSVARSNKSRSYGGILWMI